MLAAVVVVLLIALAIYNKRAPSAYDGFAQCLASKEVKMYGTYWCPNCARQKEMFGNAFRFVPYKECSPQGQRSFALCANDNITGVPTWEFPDGSRLTGVQTLETLSEKSVCSLDAAPQANAVPAGEPVQDAPTPIGVTVDVDEEASSGLQIKDIQVESAE